jgi:hypothetical protein
MWLGKTPFLPNRDCGVAGAHCSRFIAARGIDSRQGMLKDGLSLECASVRTGVHVREALYCWLASSVVVGRHIVSQQGLL